MVVQISQSGYNFPRKKVPGSIYFLGVLIFCYTESLWALTIVRKSVMGFEDKTFGLGSLTLLTKILPLQVINLFCQE